MGDYLEPIMRRHCGEHPQPTSLRGSVATAPYCHCEEPEATKQSHSARTVGLPRSLRSLAMTSLVMVLLILWSSGAASAAPQGSRWGAGYFPNVSLVTHEGQTVQLYDDLIKDKKVLINFIYATCDKACPLATAKLLQVQKRLGSRVGQDIFMYSITLDPEHDSPEVLKKYAERYRVGPGWLFLTGTRDAIDQVRYKFGERGEKESHTNFVRVGDGAKGQWMRLTLTGNIDLMVGEIGRMLDPARYYAGRPAKSFADAPKREITVEQRLLLNGQLVFRNQCAICHTLGKGSGMGPDLAGVTSRRERDWLARYLLAPDRLRADGDPIATELAAKYPSFPMPNVGLTHEQVSDLLDYLAAHDAARQGAQRTDSSPAPSPARGEGK
ncbi:MAG: electron transporter SenC [Candidatus Methylomirabilota bacterium]|nr:MAG: electron transporter SenC [candidate division NC10 bacterium]